MNEISFGSTFRIPVKQQGINKAKKVRLKSLLNDYENSLVGTGTTGYARVSMPNDKDSAFICKLKTIGYKIYQKFEGENVSKNNLDDYIKDCLENRDFMQYGKQKSRMPKTEVKNKPRHRIKEKEVNSLEKDNIRNSESYKDVLNRYGVEFAEATFF